MEVAAAVSRVPQVWVVPGAGAPGAAARVWRSSLPSPQALLLNGMVKVYNRMGAGVHLLTGVV
jgi:hypothetical protein